MSYIVPLAVMTTSSASLRTTASTIFTGVGNGISSDWLFLIGAGPKAVTASEASVLYLGINEWWAADNSGSFTVEIVPEPATLGLLLVGGLIFSKRRRLS